MMGSHQTGDKVARLRIDPLVDRFVADGLIWKAPLNPTGGKLGRPASAEPVLHVTTDDVVFKTAVAPGQAVPILRALLCLVGEIVAGVNRRRVAPELPREGARGTPKDPGDLPEGSALTFEDSEEITFMTIEMCVSFGHHPRIVTRRPSNPSSVALRY